MSYQKLDELYSKLMPKGTKAKKDAKLALEGDAQGTEEEDENLHRWSKHASEQRTYDSAGGNDGNEELQSSNLDRFHKSENTIDEEDETHEEGPFGNGN